MWVAVGDYSWSSHFLPVSSRIGLAVTWTTSTPCLEGESVVQGIALVI